MKKVKKWEEYKRNVLFIGLFASSRSNISPEEPFFYTGFLKIIKIATSEFCILDNVNEKSWLW
jgi:hypothetical protein